MGDARPYSSMEANSPGRREPPDWGRIQATVAALDQSRDALAQVTRERDDLNAEVERLREALNVAIREMCRASEVGEVKFKTNALAGEHDGS